MSSYLVDELIIPQLFGTQIPAFAVLIKVCMLLRDIREDTSLPVARLYSYPFVGWDGGIRKGKSEMD